MKSVEQIAFDSGCVSLSLIHIHFSCLFYNISSPSLLFKLHFDCLLTMSLVSYYASWFGREKTGRASSIRFTYDKRRIYLLSISSFLFSTTFCCFSLFFCHLSHADLYSDTDCPEKGLDGVDRGVACSPDDRLVTNGASGHMNDMLFPGSSRLNPLTGLLPDPHRLNHSNAWPPLHPLWNPFFAHHSPAALSFLNFLNYPSSALPPHVPPPVLPHPPHLPPVSSLGPANLPLSSSPTTTSSSSSLSTAATNSVPPASSSPPSSSSNAIRGANNSMIDSTASSSPQPTHVASLEQVVLSLNKRSSSSSPSEVKTNGCSSNKRERTSP